MKKLLGLLGTIMITGNAIPSVIAAAPNRKHSIKKRQNNENISTTSKTQDEQQPQFSTTSDSKVDIIEKEITLNENYSENIQKMLQELIDKNYIDPLRTLNMGGLLSSELDNKTIISKLEELEPKMVDWIKKQQNNKDKILILILKNSNKKRIKLVIRLENFYVLGFINNQNQYFNFKDEKIKQINDLENEITKLGEKTKQNATKYDKLQKDLAKAQIIQNINKTIIKKYDYQNINLNYTGDYNEEGLDVIIREKKIDKGKSILISKKTLNDAINQLAILEDENKQNQEIKDDLVRLIFATSEAMRFKCDEKSLEIYAEFKNDKELTNEEIDSLKKEIDKKQKEKNQLKKEIKNIIEKNLGKKSNIIQLIKIDNWDQIINEIDINIENTDELIESKKQIEKIKENEEKINEIKRNLEITELNKIIKGSKNILVDIQEKIFNKNQTITWSEYTTQLRGNKKEFGGWKDYSEVLNKFRIEIWEQLINIKIVLLFFDKNNKTINILLNKLKEKEIKKLINNQGLNEVKKTEDKQLINKTSKTRIISLVPKINENNYKNYLENKLKNEIIKNNIGKLKIILDLKFNDLNEWKNIEFKENIYNILSFILYEKIYLEKILNENIENKKNSEGYKKYCFFAKIIKDKFNKTSFYVPIIQLAILQNNLDITSLLINLDSNIINNYNYQGLTSLHQSIINDNLEILNKLLTNSAIKINIKNNISGNTALHYASMEGNLEVVKLLIEHGADVNIQDNIFGNTALHYASMEGNLEVVKLLIEHGADVNIQDNIFNETALHIATTNNYHEIVKILLNSGADVNKTILSGKTALDYASFLKKINCLKELLKNSNSKDKININHKDKNGLTALHYASMEGNLEVVKLLIEHGADVNIQDNIFNETALHYAIINGHLEIFKLLIEHGADVNIQDNKGETALHLIAIITSELNENEIIKNFKNIDLPNLQITMLNNSSNSFKTIYYVKPNIDIKMIQFLIEHKIIANINIKNSHDETAINLCENEEKRKLLKKLQSTLSNIITKTYLGKIADNNDEIILNAFIEKNEEIKKFFSRGQLYVKNITNNSAIINSPAPNIYTGTVPVTFTIAKKENKPNQSQIEITDDKYKKLGARPKESTVIWNQGSTTQNDGNDNSRLSVGERAGTSGTQGQNSNQKQQTKQYDVPGDGSCLFWTVTTAYLLPVRNNNEEFKNRFIQLFGEENLKYLQLIQKLLKQYDLENNRNLNQLWYQDQTANNLITIAFRNRVVDYIQSNLDAIPTSNGELTFMNLIPTESNYINIDDYLEQMRRPNPNPDAIQNSWGGTPEIYAMSDILNCNINVTTNDILELQTNIQNTNNTINLFHVNDRTHYNFGLSNQTPQTDTEYKKSTGGGCLNEEDNDIENNSLFLNKSQLKKDKYHFIDQKTEQNSLKNDENLNIYLIKNENKVTNKYNSLSIKQKQQKLNEINSHYQNLSENDKKAFKNKLMVIGTSGIGAGISVVGTKITVGGSASTTIGAEATGEAIEMTPLLSEGGLTVAETLSVAEGTAFVATEGTVISTEAGAAAALAPETLGLSLVIGGLAIAGTAIIWWLSGHDNTQIAKHESHNQYNEIEKYYKFLAHDQLKLDININEWDKIKQIYQENENNYQEFKNKIKSKITNFHKEDHSGWGGSITDNDINTLINILYNHFQEINNHFLSNPNHGWKIITNTVGSYFIIEEE